MYLIVLHPGYVFCFGAGEGEQLEPDAASTERGLALSGFASTSMQMSEWANMVEDGDGDSKTAPLSNEAIDAEGDGVEVFLLNAVSAVERNDEWKGVARHGTLFIEPVVMQTAGFDAHEMI